MALQGTLDARALIREGKLDRRMAWTALQGARRYLEAVASGDVASDEVIDARLGTCAECDACTPLPSHPEIAVGYCGEPFVEDTERRTCGCLIRGKVCVRSEECPRRLWVELTTP